MTGLHLLAVDDEPPALEELAFLLRRDPRVSLVHTASDASQALRLLAGAQVDGVLLDIRLPGLSGMELAQALGRFAEPPAVVFVSAFDDAAVQAFALDAIDYLLKPVSAHRLAEAVRRLSVRRRCHGDDDNPAIPVELGGVTRFVARAEVLFVEAQGDYARLHTAQASHLLRVPLATLEEQWRSAGFVRVHRSYLVALHHVRELRTDPSGGYQLLVGGREIPVSRRHTRELRDLLVRTAWAGSRS